MEDLVVSDLAGLASDLDHLSSEFEGALELQDRGKGMGMGDALWGYQGNWGHKGIWGQLNANLSMGDFADNWTSHRKDMVEAMKKLREQVRAAHEAWELADKQLADSLTEEK